MANTITIEIPASVNVTGKIYKGIWETHKDNETALSYNHNYLLTGVDGETLAKHAVANMCVVHHAFAKRKTEAAAKKYFAEVEGTDIDVMTFLASGGTAGLFKELFGLIKGARGFGASDKDIIAKYADEYGEENVRAVCEGRNPWKTEKAVPKAKKDKPANGKVKGLTQLQKEEILRTAKQVKTEMAEELEVADMLDETMRLAGIPEALHGIGKVYAGQIIK